MDRDSRVSFGASAFVRGLVICGLALTVASGCSGEGTAPQPGLPPPAPPPPPPPPAVVLPTNVVITEGSVIVVMGRPPVTNTPSGCTVVPPQTMCPDVQIADDVKVTLRNLGGPGEYYLEFWGQKGQIGGNAKIAESQRVSVLAGYLETLTYRLDPTNAGPSYFVATVKVKSRPINTAVYSQTACLKVRESGVCP